MKRGFTLIELSIVLIIIGLLVGGVLAGRDLIKQAQLGAVSRDFSNYQTALNTFQLKYGDGAVPGDFDQATSYFSGTANGDGDGTVNADSERLDFWQHLSLSGLIDGNYTGVAGSGADLFNPENTPASPIDGGYYYGSGSTGTNYGGQRLGNYIIFGAPNTSDGSAYSSLLSAADAFNLDTKSDDGDADRGTVWVQKGRTLADDGWDANCVANDPNAATSGAYDFSTVEPACRIMFHYQ